MYKLIALLICVVVVFGEEDDCNDVVKRILQHKKSIGITLNLHTTEPTLSAWDTVLNPENNILYVALSNVSPEALKQPVVTLLELAEEKMHVDAVVLCLRKDLQNLVRDFRLVGFEPLSPSAAPQSANDNNLFLIYKIKDD